MKLQTLIADLDLIIKAGHRGGEVTGLCSHSKQLLFGNLFIAKRGCLESYIEEAIANGALGVVTEIYNPFFPPHVVQLITKDVVTTEKELVRRFYKEPAKKLFMVGVTGTNGKTTITYLLKQLFEHLALKVGLLGTNEYLIDKRSMPSMHTTPDLVTNQKLLREMVKCGCEVALLEVSSHALDQNRTSLIHFDVAIFTNLTQDHLDYHKNFENYFMAKAKLFESLSSDKVAILPDEGIWAARLKALTKAKVITYGFSESAMVRATDIALSLHKSTFTLHFQEQSVKVALPLLGRFNILNYLAALSALLAKGYALADLVTAKITSVSGRMERVPNEGGAAIYVDYAHTPDGLECALKTVREYVKERLIVVFGCGGQRDKEKRPLMGAVAGRYADVVVITSDNPRNENPQQIIEEIVKGVEGEYHIEVDRKEAIAWALKEATRKDLVLIAGKGHESIQIFANKTIDFDDRVQVANILKESSLCSAVL